jgi:hypothetical protein
VVNTLTGSRAELRSHFASHMDLNAIVDGSGDDDPTEGTCLNLKRHTRRSLQASEWSSEKGQDPYWILDTVEFKTAWHPIGS